MGLAQVWPTPVVLFRLNRPDLATVWMATLDSSPGREGASLAKYHPYHRRTLPSCVDRITRGDYVYTSTTSDYIDLASMNKHRCGKARPLVLSQSDLCENKNHREVFRLICVHGPAKKVNCTYQYTTYDTAIKAICQQFELAPRRMQRRTPHCRNRSSIHQRVHKTSNCVGRNVYHTLPMLPPAF